MIAPMTDEQTRAVKALMADPSGPFATFLKWLADSREMLHQHMYTTLDPAVVHCLQGEAKILFDVVNTCNEASGKAEVPAIPPPPETPHGGA